MECISPLSIPRPNGTGAGDRVTVPCGKCMACLQTKRAQWTFRLSEELRYSKTAFFVTLTYDDQKIPLKQISENSFIPIVIKRDVQLFLKRLRKTQKSEIRYYLVAEYGSNTHRPHYHAIMFNVDADREQATSAILKAWKNGMVHLGSVTPASIHYVTKYAITKTFTPRDAEKPFALISKGIGRQYVHRCRSYHEGNLDHFHVKMEDGILGSLPRYYAEKLYTSAEREERAVRARKMTKTPMERYANDADPFKRASDVKEHFVTQTIKTTKSKLV